MIDQRDQHGVEGHCADCPGSAPGIDPERNRQDGPGNEGGRGPVAVGAARRRLSTDQQQQGEAKGEQRLERGCATPHRAQAEQGPDQPDREQGPKGCELGDQEFAEIGAVRDAVIDMGDGGGVAQGGKVVLPVPPQVGGEDGERQKQREPRTWTRQRPPTARQHQHHQQCRGQKCRHRVFRQQAQPHGKSQPEPVAPALVLERPKEEEHAERPEEQQRCVGGDEQAERAHKRHGEEGES